MSENILFPLGQIVFTPGIENLANSGHDFSQYLYRHSEGDWGDLNPEDQIKQAYSLKHGFMLLSCYKINDNVTLWIKTESDRTVTTLLLPSEW